MPASQEAAMRRIALVAAVVILALPAPAKAATHQVTIVDSNFLPTKVKAKVGDFVQWGRSPTSFLPHNVREDSEIFYSGPPTQNPTFLFIIGVSAGKFHYYCEVHGSETGGMDGRVKVPVKITKAPPGLRFTVRWATGNSTTGELFDVRFRVGSGPWLKWKTDAQGNKGVFGKNGKPVPVESGTTYRFRARSQTDEGVSMWSPPRQFTP